ncbi:hypothetical protein GCM10023331_00410 [Algivirga pacifica]|uniref:MetA-pathway of phenol degradation n=1 Tax=Algivirga pacifica TaxID=1162670 RepID=A0ABP9CV24_9BACT
MEYYFPLGLGAAYTPKHYDVQHNPLNNAIGQSFSFLLYTGIQQYLRIAPGWKLEGSIKILHYSNGSLAQPNDGINTLTLQGGVVYAPSQTLPQAKPYPVYHKKWQWLVASEIGWKSYEVNSGRYPFYNLSVLARKPFSFSNQWVIGTEWSYSPALREEIQFINRMNETSIPEQQSLLAMLSGVEFGLGRVSIPLLIGAHVYKPKGMGIPLVFQKVGIRYRITDQWMGSLLLKTFTGRSDGVGWGVAYRMR